MTDTLSRYTLRELVLVTVYITVALLLAVWVTQAPRLITLVVSQGLSIGTFLALSGWALPLLVLAILPTTFLISVLHTYNRMVSDREMIIMRSAGLSNFSIARPAIFASLLVSGITMVLSLYFVPASERKFHNLEAWARHDFSALVIREGRFNSFGHKFTIYVRSREKDGLLRGILVQDRRNRRERVTLMAKRGVVIRSAAGPRIVLFDGNRQRLESTNGQLSYLSFKMFSVNLGLISQGGRSRWRRASERSLAELLWPKNNTAVERHVYKKLIAAGHNRIVTAFLPIGLAMVVLICLLSGEFNKRGQTKRILLAIGLGGGIQGSAIALHFVAADATEVVPLMYLNAIGPIVVGSLYLWSRRIRPRVENR
jgi:lipopolysaccharide export system permease protein